MNKYNENYYKITQNDIDNRLDRFKSSKFGKGFGFECIIANVLRSKNYKILQGYDSAKDKGKYKDSQTKTKDFGIDIICKKDFNTIIQCKHNRYDNAVGGPTVMQLVGSCIYSNSKHGMFYTTSYFTDQCKTIVERVENIHGIKIILKDWKIVQSELQNLLS